MLDRLKLRDNILGLFVAGLALSGLDRMTAGALFFLASLLLALYWSLRPTVLPIKTKGLFEARTSTVEFKELLEKEPELKQAVQYCFSLSSDDFLRFTRMVVEYRDEANQNSLKDVSDFFRRSKKD